MKNINQDSIENLFCQIANSNPTCHQFLAVLKTVILNNFVAPVSKSANCENDNCDNLNNFRKFLDNCNSVHENETELLENNDYNTLQ